MTSERIKVGILLDSLEIPAWQYALLEDILAAECALLALVLLSNSDEVDRERKRRSVLYDVFERHERRHERVARDARESRNARELLHHIDCLPFPEPATRNEALPGSSTAVDIRAHGLDVIIALGGLRHLDALCPQAKHGIWYFWHDCGQTDLGADGSSVGFWQVIKHQPFIRSALLIRKAGGDADAIAYESCSGVYRKSYIQSRNEHLWKIPSFVRRSLHRLREMGEEKFSQSLTQAPRNHAVTKTPPEWRLTGLRLAFPVASYLLWRIWLKLQRVLFVERWILMFSVAGEATEPAKFSRILPSKSRFWADPFVVRRDGGYYIFFEDASLITWRGHISVLRIEPSGEYSRPQAVLQRPYHLSYPFILEWRNELFLIPESGENGTIELYRSKAFPYDWEFVHNLMENVSAYDATLLEHDGMWWMFTNIKAHPHASSWDELHLFYADSPVARDWQAHPMNPVISDVRYARPAGKIFRKDGRLYRPSQDSSHRYGYGLNINEIVELTTTTYRERVATTLTPNWSRSVKGTHTFNLADEFVIIDAIYRSRR